MKLKNHFPLRALLSFALFALPVFSGLTACQPEATPEISRGETNVEALRLVREAEKLQEGVQLGHRLNTLSSRDRSALSTLLGDLKIGLLRLAENSQDLDALRLLKRALLEWEKAAVQLQRTDDAVFTDFLGRTYSLLERQSRVLGFDMENLTWALYRTDFAGGLGDFSSFSTGVNWETDWALDEPLVKINASGVKAWLVSPTFDLREVRDPGFRIEHLFMMNRNNRFPDDIFDRKRIVNEAFKVMVSTNYEKGAPEQAQWERVDISPLPSSYNFHAVESPIVSLEKFRGEKVTVAFLFDMHKGLGNHYVTWQLNRFELFGAGPQPKTHPRIRALWSHSFTTKELKPFQVGEYGAPGSPRWESFAPAGSVKFAKVGSASAPNESWLLSPRLELTGQDLQLLVRETVQNTEWRNLSLLVSADYQGGDPREARWTELNRVNPPLPAKDKWTDFNAGPFDLQSFAGQSIVVAFRYRDEGGPGNRIWEIGSLQIQGLNDEDLQVREEDYRLNATSGEEMQNFNFATGTLTPFVTWTIPGSSQEWIPLTTPKGLRYAKAGSGETATDSWLISPALKSKSKDLKLILKQVVKSPDWSDWRIKISENYTAGDPTLATWQDLNFSVTPPILDDKWNDANSLLDLAAYANKTFRLAFHYRDAGGPGARVWEIESLSFRGGGRLQILKDSSAQAEFTHGN